MLSPLIDDALLTSRYRHKRRSIIQLLWAYLRRIKALLSADQFNLVWIEKEALPWFPAWIEKWFLRNVPYILDFDDAIFHNYDKHGSFTLQWLFGNRIDQIMSSARLVVVGNSYLAARASRAGSEWVEEIPTVVNVENYMQKIDYGICSKPIIVWIGSPSTLRYLIDLKEAFIKLSLYHEFTLRVIGAGGLNWDGIDIEAMNWSEATEAAMIRECDIGIMPLRNTPWEQGKCAYKVIQYMACGLPVVASPVGANRSVLVDGLTGLFASSDVEWVEKLDLLIKRSALRQKLGQVGRLRVEREYSLQQYSAKMVEIVFAAAKPKI